MARRNEGMIARWNEGMIARWNDGEMARWHDCARQECDLSHSGTVQQSDKW
ncbi:MAG: hypothetical protein R6V32_06190 [Bacteroidales bacterium]